MHRDNYHSSSIGVCKFSARVALQENRIDVVLSSLQCIQSVRTGLRSQGHLVIYGQLSKTVIITRPDFLFFFSSEAPESEIQTAQPRTVGDSRGQELRAQQMLAYLQPVLLQARTCMNWRYYCSTGFDKAHNYSYQDLESEEGTGTILVAHMSGCHWNTDRLEVQPSGPYEVVQVD